MLLRYVHAFYLCLKLESAVFYLVGIPICYARVFVFELELEVAVFTL